MSNRQPKLILRESCIDDMVKNWPAGSFLELGAGTGYMTRHFLNLGFGGSCYDLGEHSRQLLAQNLAPFGSRMRVVGSLADLPNNSFDYLFAFEVLEHIEDDGAAMQEWTRCLKPGGKVLLSMPAHSRKFGKSDEIVGHVRRYEKAQLHRLLSDAGYQHIQIINYGFPITEATRRISNWLVSRETGHLKLSPEQRSTQSSFTRPPIISKLISAFGEWAFLPWRQIQRLFYPYDWGDGYVASAEKTPPSND
jgi:SAM-dependent methyltransferase